MPKKVGQAANHRVKPRVKQKAISLCLFDLYPVAGINLVFESFEFPQGTGLGCIIYGLSWLQV